MGTAVRLTTRRQSLLCLFHPTHPPCRRLSFSCSSSPSWPPPPPFTSALAALATAEASVLEAFILLLEHMVLEAMVLATVLATASEDTTCLERVTIRHLQPYISPLLNNIG